MSEQQDPKPLPPFQPRRAYDDSDPEGYQESDRDFLANNRELAVRLLEEYAQKLAAQGESA